METKKHLPVLLQAVLECLAPQKGESYLDLTAGYGGHASAVLSKTQAPEKAVLVDRDSNAIAHLETLWTTPPRPRLVHSDFAAATERLMTESMQFDMILLDLGVSSPHLDIASRGFSFRMEAPLDMRMDQTSQPTAARIVNEWDAEDLVKIFWQYGEEPAARRIVKAIVAHRPIATTYELAAIVTDVVPKKGPIHPATRVFQALRIAVNDELGQLTQALPRCLQLLAPGGRIAVISFHSLEDRIVKQFLSEAAGNRYDAPLRLLTKKPAVAPEQEIAQNKRARSAKLRAAYKNKNS